ncbi:MAG: endolytic transglycosylase MltG [Caulobacteraceae bacterium]
MSEPERAGPEPVWRRRLAAQTIAARTIGAAAVVGLALMVLALTVAWQLHAPGPPARRGGATQVVLPAGAGLPEIAADLRRAGVIRSAPIFVAAAQLSGAARQLKAGEYAFASRETMARIVDDIRAGAVVRHRVTIPEGITSEQVAEILARASFLTGVAPAPPEGAILPETYEARWGEDRARLLTRMMRARDALLASLWLHRRADLPYLSPGEAVILASIVEKETARADERPKIAAVFLNRLAKGMRLESDPTVIYGLTGGRPLGHGLRASELAAPGPYNTYLNAGLPPTPIDNPGRASLAAVLDPPTTPDLYFVADGTGGHVFAATFEAHQKNVAHWRAIEIARAASPAASPSGRRP